MNYKTKADRLIKEIDRHEYNLLVIIHNYAYWNTRTYIDHNYLRLQGKNLVEEHSLLALELKLEVLKDLISYYESNTRGDADEMRKQEKLMKDLKRLSELNRGDEK